MDSLEWKTMQDDTHKSLVYDKNIFFNRFIKESIYETVKYIYSITQVK